ncbi:hypothetical protein [Caballeronia sordidicola]|uniref:Uncharacterized protein n=1 Tax=Caballeronia sordidicola TaxID=196367 RepID=A0A242N486_CABSO|nr:hypothetical protein [Caballeronia sordidicola]OTP78487.1 hypothetical protein PAMC26577_04810 [Caballeronia sordidicola]
MKIKTISLFFGTAAIDAYALFVGILAWRWWHHYRGAQAQFTSAIILMSFYVVFRLIRERGPWLLIPPVLGLTWLCSVAAAPFCLWILSFIKTWQCLQAVIGPVAGPVTEEKLEIWR